MCTKMILERSMDLAKETEKSFNECSNALSGSELETLEEVAMSVNQIIYTISRLQSLLPGLSDEEANSDEVLTVALDVFTTVVRLNQNSYISKQNLKIND